MSKLQTLSPSEGARGELGSRRFQGFRMSKPFAFHDDHSRAGPPWILYFGGTEAKFCESTRLSFLMMGTSLSYTRLTPSPIAFSMV